MTETTAVEPSGQSSSNSGSTASDDAVSQEDFRAYQSSMSKQLAAARQENAGYIKERRQAELDKIEDPVAREAAELKQQIEDLTAQVKSVGAESEKVAALKRISEETGVPIDALQAADNETGAYRIAALYKRDSRAKGSPTQAIMGDAPASEERNFEKEILAAMADGTPSEVAALKTEARSFLSKE